MPRPVLASNCRGLLLLACGCLHSRVYVVSLCATPRGSALLRRLVFAGRHLRRRVEHRQVLVLVGQRVGALEAALGLVEPLVGLRRAQGLAGLGEEVAVERDHVVGRLVGRLDLGRVIAGRCDRRLAHREPAAEHDAGERLDFRGLVAALAALVVRLARIVALVVLTDLVGELVEVGVGGLPEVGEQAMRLGTLPIGDERGEDLDDPGPQRVERFLADDRALERSLQVPDVDIAREKASQSDEAVLGTRPVLLPLLVLARPHARELRRSMRGQTRPPARGELEGPLERVVVGLRLQEAGAALGLGREHPLGSLDREGRGRKRRQHRATDRRKRVGLRDGARVELVPALELRALSGVELVGLDRLGQVVELGAVERAAGGARGRAGPAGLLELGQPRRQRADARILGLVAAARPEEDECERRHGAALKRTVPHLLILSLWPRF